MKNQNPFGFYENRHYEQKCSLVVVYIYNDFKRAVIKSYPKISQYELGKAVLMALGDSEDVIESLPEDKVKEAIDYTSATRIKVYLTEAQDGELVEISRDEYYTPKSAELRSGYNRSETLGEIILTSTAYHRTPSYGLSGRSYFTIRGEVLWEGYPNCQLSDLLVISSTGNIDNNFKHSATGRWDHAVTGMIEDNAYLYDEDGGDGTYISLTNPSMLGMGAEFPVGIGQQGKIIINKIFAFYGVSAQNDISCQVSYAHAILTWNPSFSISSSGSISFGGLAVQRKVYNGRAFTLYHE